jgi:hypothetical protein
VVDAVDLVLAEGRVHAVVEGFGGGQVVAEGFFDDDAAPAFGLGGHAGGGEGVAGRP